MRSVKIALAASVVFGALFFIYQTYWTEPLKTQFSYEGLSLNAKGLEEVIKSGCEEIERNLLAQGIVEKSAPSEDHEKPYAWEHLYPKYSAPADALDSTKVIVDKAIDGLDLDAALEHSPAIHAQRAYLNAMLKRMLFMAVKELFLSSPKVFDWCLCIPPEKRLALAVHVVNDIHKNYAPDYHLRYTSLASGSLMLDYLIVQELAATGYTSMTINLVDPGYFNLADVERLKKISPLPAEKSHADYLLNLSREATNVQWGVRGVMSARSVGEEPAEKDIALEEEMEKFITTVALAVFIERLGANKGNGIEVINWSDAHDYLERAKKYDAEKSDVLLLVDPSDGIFTVPPYPSLANVVELELSLLVPAKDPSADKPLMYIFMPKSRGVRVYSNKGNWKHDIQNDQVDAFFKEVVAVIDKANALKQSTPRLVTALLTALGKRKDIKISWLLDIYLLFQEMVTEVMSDPKKAVVYVLDYETPKTRDEESEAVIMKIDPQAYKDVDIIGVRWAQSYFEYSNVTPSVIKLIPAARKELAQKKAAARKKLKASQSNKDNILKKKSQKELKQPLMLHVKAD